VQDVCKMLPEKWYGKVHGCHTTVKSGTSNGKLIRVWGGSIPYLLGRAP